MELQIKNTILKKFTSTKGLSTFIALPILIFFFWGMLIFQIETLGQISKIDDLHQMSQIMAREIALTGKVDNSTYRYLEDLENTFRMDVDMDVDGTFIGKKKLQLETPVTVTLTYNTTYKFPLIRKTKEKPYVQKSVETVEEYNKR